MTVFASRPTIAHLVILLVVVRAILLNGTTLLKMLMMPGTSGLFNSNFATQDLIAIVHRMVVVVRFPACKDSPVLVDVGALQVCELLVENPLDLSFALDVVHH